MPRPILMQLDFQSVEKKPFSKLAWASPIFLELGLAPLRMSRSFLQDRIQSYFPLPEGPSCRKSPSARFSIQLGQIRSQSSIRSKITFFSILSGIVILFDPVGSQKCWRWFPATGPLEKRETALDRSWRKLQFILNRGKPISNILGSKAHANVLNGTFSTDYKSDCIIIGLNKNN